MIARLLSVILVAAALAGPAAAQGTGKKPGEGADRLRLGDEEFRQGDLDSALRAYEGAQAEATRAGDDRALADALLRSAQVRQARAARMPRGSGPGEARDALLRTAEAELDAVVVRGDARQKAQARNGLGLLQLQKEEYQKACDTFDAIKPEDFAPSQRWVLQYNRARAYELKGDGRAAFDGYRTSLAERPDSPAAVKAFDLLGNRRVEDPIPKALALANDLISRNQGPLAARMLVEVLEKLAKAGQPGVEALLTPLVRHYAGSLIDPAGFEAIEWPKLQPLLKSPAIAPRVREIFKAFVEPFDAAIPDPQSRNASVPAFPQWSADAGEQAVAARAAMSALLRRLGDDYLRHVGEAPGESAATANMAWSRHAAAWAFDPSDPRAALACAIDLLDYSPFIDKDHSRFDRMLEGLFLEKGARYAMAGKTAEDWGNLLRIHFTLGSIFEHKQEWGSEGNVRSAIFQWSHAVDADRNARKLDPTRPRAPGLYRHLADAYKAVNRQDKSYEHYLAAADCYKAQGKSDDVLDCLRRAQDLGVAPNLEQKTMLARLTEPPDKPDIQMVYFLSKAGRSARMANALWGSGVFDSMKNTNAAYTIFLPTDTAISTLPEGAFDELLKPENKENLRRFLGAHIASGATTGQDASAPAGTAVKDVFGKFHDFRMADGKLLVGDAMVLGHDLSTDPGKGENTVIFHTIDRPLVDVSPDGRVVPRFQQYIAAPPP